jgi:hypothetical protein
MLTCAGRAVNRRYTAKLSIHIFEAEQRGCKGTNGQIPGQFTRPVHPAGEPLPAANQPTTPHSGDSLLKTSPTHNFRSPLATLQNTPGDTGGSFEPPVSSNSRHSSSNGEFGSPLRFPQKPTLNRAGPESPYAKSRSSNEINATRMAAAA